MSQCKQCGATLPENSPYCLQCGTENSGRGNNPALPTKELEFLKPAITGGVVLGVLSALPFISAVNCICCLWVLGGGGLTTWLLNKQRPGELKYGDGAIGGVISGLIGAIVTTALSIPLQMLMFTQQTVDDMQEQFSQMDMPPAVRDAILQFFTPGFNLNRVLLGLVFNVILFGLFAMIGGIITVAILNRKKLD
jgi:hypothetical protein